MAVMGAASIIMGAQAAGAACSPEGSQLIRTLHGSWRGGGTLSPVGGSPERISCRVTYQTAGGRIQQNLNCAGASYSFQAASRVSCNGNRVSGTWAESVFGNTGNVRGSITGQSLNLNLRGSNFAGQVAVNVSGNRHSVRITQYDAGSGRYVTVASVSLGR